MTLDRRKQLEHVDGFRALNGEVLLIVSMVNACVRKIISRKMEKNAYPVAKVLKHKYGSFWIIPSLHIETASWISFFSLVDLGPVDCIWGHWSEWLPCTTSCGGNGTTTGFRSISRNATNGGLNCTGDTEITIPCNNGPCAGIKLFNLKYMQSPIRHIYFSLLVNSKILCFALL